MSPVPLSPCGPGQELGVSASELRAMFSQAAVGIAVTGTDGRFIDANEYACSLLGRSLEELRGRTFLELTHPDDIERTRQNVERLQAGETDSYVIEKRYVRKDGSEVWSCTTVGAIRNARGEPERFLGILQDISARMLDQQVKSRLASLVESSDDAIITKSLDGIITSWNPAATRIFGYEAEEMIGAPISMLFPEDRVNEEERILQRVHRNEPVHHYQTVRRRKDGSLIDVSLSISPVRDGAGRIVGASKIARDITRQKQDEAALLEHAQVLELLATTGRAIASGLELKGILQRVTDLGRQLTGAEFCAFQASYPGEGAVRSEDITQDPRHEDMAQQLGEPPGHVVRSFLAVPVIARSGQVLGGLYFGHSSPGVFTERAEKLIVGVAAQAAVAMDNANLYEAAQREIASREEAENRMREADRRKDEFLATLAHELRNPLAPIRQAAAVVGAAGVSEQQRRWGLEVIDRQVRHMSALLNDLLDIARITRGVFDLRRAPTTVGEVVDAALETATPAITLREHELRVDVPDRNAPLVGDVLRLAQILANLLLNAAKYTDPGGIITLRASAQSGRIEFAVRDTGIGIAPEAMPSLFVMFTQVSSHRSHADGGLGIGLALARGLAELHGGSIEARSEGPGRGSEFIVRIPSNVGDSPRETAQAASAARAGATRRVLIADDNEDAARTLAMLLEVSGHHVWVAHDGEQALREYDRHHPEFVLLDIGMPRLDGYEVARRLRRGNGGPAPTLIALTGWGQDADKNKAKEAGFDRHFTKPVDPERILELLG